MEVSRCKNSVEKIFERIDTTESTFSDWCTERKYLENEIDNLKKVIDKRLKEIEKLKCENKKVREEMNGCKKSLENLLERIKLNESNYNEFCKKKKKKKFI